jgi:dihydrolipoamide dehydrogenase
LGRTPKSKKIAADKAGVAVSVRGFTNVDIQMRTEISQIFAIGDIEGTLMAPDILPGFSAASVSAKGAR